MLHYKTITELSQDLSAKKYSSVELTQFYLDRIQQFDSQLNSFITVTAEQALQQAKQADQRRSNGESFPLLGIPIAHKDNFCTQGIRTTCGSKMLDDFIAPYNATIVDRLAATGVIMLGKTNMDEFAMGSSNENSFYGAVKNPWELTHIPGGSSGGSAAAVAARLAPATTGTDTGGSVRQPAALCGITGIKPTYGRVSRYGMIAFASSLDQAGIMGLSAEDCALVLNAMAGYDTQDSTSIHCPVPDYTAQLTQSIKGLRIGIPKEYFNENLDPKMAKIIEDAIAEYKKLGAIIQEITLPAAAKAVPVYYVVAPAECSSNLSRFDGVRFGHSHKNAANLTELYEYSRSEGFGEEVKRRIMIGTYVLSAGYYDAYYLKAQKIRRLLSEDFQRAFSEVDVIIGPITPTPAFKLGEKKADPISMYLSDLYTIPANLAGLPSLSIPAGFIDGLPVGVQLTGAHFTEEKLLTTAHQYQLHTDWHKKVPAGF